ncbi:MAG: T9SS type A sorting domain-containing protein, partial [Bacteroidales bacterium]|nr:T9SS type A sorting domain-containing protein [Bacteroidales bacterium]
DSNSTIYLRDLNDIEGLVYKFNVSEGDAFDIFNPFHFTIVPTTVLAVDSVLIEPLGQFRKRITLAPYGPYGNEEYWIEGIGSIAGIINSGYHILPLTGAGYDLLCQWENDWNMFSNPAYDFCYETTVSTQENQESNIIIGIYPSPVTGISKLSIEGLQTNCFVEIRDVYGNLCSYYTYRPGFPLEIDKDLFSPGLYFLILKNKNQIIANKKFFIQ